jgi:hypothetical protein
MVFGACRCRGYLGGAGHVEINCKGVVLAVDEIGGGILAAGGNHSRLAVGDGPLCQFASKPDIPAERTLATPTFRWSARY